jgi:hypothetical protein
MAKAMGLNTQLPGSSLSSKQVMLNKIKAYDRADQDSVRKRESEQRDPYHSYIVSGHVGPVLHKDSLRRPMVKSDVKSDVRADELLRQLDRLQESFRQPGPPMPLSPPMPIQAAIRRYSPPPFSRSADTPSVAGGLPQAMPESDPQLDRLNNMLDKVIRIQHPAENKPVATNENAEEVLPADSASNAIAAVIPMDQTLVTGGTIALRLEEDVSIHGLLIPRGQWVYGVVTISNDRMMVHIRSLRSDRSLYNADLQVYDLDGLPGIHIPGMISRDVAKESADEGVSGLNVTTYDPSLGAQATNAGIQAAKTLFGRKVRLVQVSVRAGYQVLLKNSKPTAIGNKRDSPVLVVVDPQPPGIVPGGSFLQRCRTEGMWLDLQGIYLQDSLLWIALRWNNHSPIGYVPDYYRWVIRDKRSFRRTAQQELPLQPLYTPPLAPIGGDSTASQWTGFHPFALAKDKELVLEIGEKNGGRTLTLVIDHKRLLKAQPYEQPH